MPRITIPISKIKEILPVLDRKTSDICVVTLKIRKRKKPIKKGDLLQLYFRNMNGRMEKLAVVKCKASIDSGSGQIVTLRNTYDRKYYLNRKVKAAGFSLEMELTSKTILIPPDMVELAEANKALKELSSFYQYGVQYTMM